ncbi:MAG: flagellar hook-length control protein FliK [Parasphingorhabdus sp.]
METQFTNLNLNSSLSSSDDKYLSVLGRNNSKPSDQSNGRHFSDQFAKADATFQIESGLSDKAEVLPTEVQSDVVLGAEKEERSPPTEFFSGPIVSLAEVSGLENASFFTTSESLPLSANSHPESSEAEFDEGTSSIRKSASLNFDEWETDFAATTELGDNFAAVESAIAKYAARTHGVDQAQSAILPAAMQTNSKYSPITPTMGDVKPSPSWAGTSEKAGQPEFVPAKDPSFSGQDRSMPETAFGSRASTRSFEVSQSDRSLNKFNGDEELPRPTSAKPDPIEYRPANLVPELKPGRELKAGVGSNIHDVDAGFARVSQGSDSKSIVSTSASDVKISMQDTKLLDSSNRRLADKTETNRTANKNAKEDDFLDFEAIDEKPVMTRTEMLASAGEKVAQNSIPLSLLNPVTVPTNQKPISFDWNSPNFAERFGKEISDLAVNGDLKKFEINPRNLGRLEVSLIARGTSEVIQIEAESQAARDVIVQHSQAIQEMLKAQGRSDLSVRVDLKDAGFGSASEGNGQNLAQQDGTGTREDRPGSQSGSGSTISADIRSEPEVAREEGRYA